MFRDCANVHKNVQRLYKCTLKCSETVQMYKKMFRDCTNVHKNVQRMYKCTQKCSWTDCD